MGIPTTSAAPATRQGVLASTEWVAQHLNDAALRERLLKLGIEPEASSPEGLRDLIQSEITKWARVMKEADIRAE